MKYLAESFPSEERDKVRIIDIGAGTGLVARGVCSVHACADRYKYSGLTDFDARFSPL